MLNSPRITTAHGPAHPAHAVDIVKGQWVHVEDYKGADFWGHVVAVRVGPGGVAVAFACGGAALLPLGADVEVEDPIAFIPAQRTGGAA